MKLITKAIDLRAVVVLIFLTILPSLGKSQGSMQGGGGGNFSVSLFWESIRTVVIALEERDLLQKPLSKAQTALVVSLMNPKKVSIEITSTLLYAKDSAGRIVPVDALNFPEQFKIILYQPSWQRHFVSGLEIRHLILHEFLGLARIDDSGYKLSTKYFPAGLMPIPFAWNMANCSARGFFLHHSEDHYMLVEAFTPTNSQSDVGTVGRFSAPFLVGHEESLCADLKDHGEDCDYKDLRREVKKLSLLAEFKIANSYTQKHAQYPRYFAKFDLRFKNTIFQYGWGAAASNTFRQDPEITMFGQLVALRRQTAQKKVLGVGSYQSYNLNSDGGLSLGIQMLNPEFYSALLDAGIEIQPAKQTNVEGSPLRMANLVELLSEYTKSRGAKTSKESDRMLEKTVFKNLSPVVPIYVDLSCEITE